MGRKDEKLGGEREMKKNKREEKDEEEMVDRSFQSLFPSLKLAGLM